MSAIISPSNLSSNDRFGLSLFIATLVHGVIILGITFVYELGSQAYTPPSLDVILVQTRSEEAPEEADRMAQHNQQASGETDIDNTPSSPFSSQDPRPHEGIAPVEMRAASPQERTTEQTQVLVSERAKTLIDTQSDTQSDHPVKDISGDELVERSLEMARLVTEISEREATYARRPTINYLSSTSAKSVIEASYIADWKHKVEQIGNLNYPDEAYRKRLTGRLILNVKLNAEGEVLDVVLAKSSGHRVLDDAAVRIVELAAPFAPFAAEMRKSYDQVVITRTWVFKGGRLNTNE